MYQSQITLMSVARGVLSASHCHRKWGQSVGIVCTFCAVWRVVLRGSLAGKGCRPMPCGLYGPLGSAISLFLFADLKYIFYVLVRYVLGGGLNFWVESASGADRH